MKYLKITFLPLLFVGLGLGLWQCASAGGTLSSSGAVSGKFIAGFTGGTYESIAKAMNESKLYEFKITPSQGSGEILTSLAKKESDVALVQLDVLFEKYKSNKEINDSVRIMMPLYTEEMHVLAQKSVNSFAELSGKKLCLGPRNSGTADTAKLILKVFNINEENATFDFDAIDACISKLSSGGADALFVVSGAPVDLLQKLSGDKVKNIKLLQVSSTDLVKITNMYFHYRRTEIPANTYAWQKEAVATVAVVSAFVVHKDFETKSAGRFMAHFFQNSDKLGPLHPKLGAFDEQTYRFYLAARTDYYHPGSVIYFQSQQVRKEYE